MEVVAAIEKIDGSFWMMISPYLKKNGETHKPKKKYGKTWVAGWTSRELGTWELTYYSYDPLPALLSPWFST